MLKFGLPADLLSRTDVEADELVDAIHDTVVGERVDVNVEQYTWDSGNGPEVRNRARGIAPEGTMPRTEDF